MANKRTWTRVLAVVGGIVIALAGCSGRGDSGPPAPTAEEVAAAEYTMLAAIQTMYTWYPTVDASPADAYQRAAPALRVDMRPQFTSSTAGTAALWPEWRKQKLTMTAASQLAPGTPSTADASGEIQRAILVTQTVTAPDGRTLDESTFTIERVVAKYGKDGWKVEAINFFPENQFFVPTCPPGQANDPAPNGPCKPIPPSPSKTCADGTSVPTSAVCPAQRNQPATTKCPDGTTVAVSAGCPVHGPRTKQCPDGSTVADDQQCPATEAQPCPEGQTRGTDGQCVATQPEPCPEGQTRNANGTCTSPTVTCPDGSTAPSQAECPKKAQEVVICPDGSTAPSQAECPKPEEAPPPPPPCPISGQVRGTDGACTCGAGRATYPEGCGDYIGAPAPGWNGATSPPRQSVSFRSQPRRRRRRGLQCCHAGRPSAPHRRRC